MKVEERCRTVSSTTGLGDSAPGLHPTFTVEESIVMRAFAAGKSDKQVRVELRITLELFRRLLRNVI
jgi:DNA-binding NarL/FixJ family response regulator